MITDINQATRELGLLLINDLGMPIKVEEINEGRYKILKYKTEDILVVFKRQHFLRFDDHAHGESINKEDLDKANVKRIFFIYSDGRIYTISPKTIFSQSITRTTEAEGKETYSFDIKLLVRFDGYEWRRI